MKTSFWTRILDLISPRQCVICGERLSITERAVCSSCYLHLPRTTYQFTPYDNPMAQLFWGLAPISRAAALFFYESHAEAAQLIYDLKYADRPDIGEVMGRLVAKELQPSGFFDGIDGIVPIPLAKKRQRQRGYNQSQEIACGISEITNLPIYNNVVRRNVFEGSQTNKGRWERNENVEKVFEMTDETAIQGKHLLIIDDVVTTGATVIACAKELCKAGNVKVSVLALGFAKS